MSELYLSEKDFERIQINVDKCETCEVFINPNTKKCIFCNKKQCWSCKLHCMYDYHKKEVKR